MSESETHLVATPTISIPLDEFDYTVSRSSGPGGQNVNKVNSKVLLRWSAKTSESLPEAVKQRFLRRFNTRITSEGVFIISSQRYRDQPRNREDCLFKLAEMIREVAAPPKKRKPTRATRGSKERRLQSKKELSQKKQNRKKPRWDG